MTRVEEKWLGARDSPREGTAFLIAIAREKNTSLVFISSTAAIALIRGHTWIVSYQRRSSLASQFALLTTPNTSVEDAISTLELPCRRDDAERAYRAGYLDDGLLAWIDRGTHEQRAFFTEHSNSANIPTRGAD